jgi:DHA2 family multidrug resistance protein
MSEPQPLPRHPALITASVMLASLLYSIDWTIGVVALPHMQGSFSATQDQIAWVITSYIVASAVMIPTGGWLSARFGRKRVFVVALSGFMLASALCGAAESLTLEVMARVLQGMCGAFLIPLSHAIILDTYPPAEHGKAMALWGMGSVAGSAIGPVLGGYLTEFASWRWIYYINLPLGVVALVGVLIYLPETLRDAKRRLDWFGFLSLAIGVGALQMMLDRGQRLDWFESEEIVLLAWMSALGLYLFAVHIVSTREPFLDPHLIANRKFFITLLLISYYGFLSVPPMVLMPSFLQDLRGYNIDAVGLLQMPRGIGMFAAMFVSGRITGRIEPRLIIAAGLVALALTNYEMSTWTAEVGQWPIVWTGLMQGAGAGIMLVPIQIIAFPSLAPQQRTEATSVFNAWRSVCSSVGVSLSLTIFVTTAGEARSRLVEYVSPYHAALHATAANRHLDASSIHGLAAIERQIDQQSAMFGYNAVFRFLAAASLSSLPLLLLVGRKSKPQPGRQDEPPEALVIGE